MGYGSAVNRLVIISSLAALALSGCSENPPPPAPSPEVSQEDPTPPPAVAATAFHMELPEPLKIKECHAVLAEFSGRTFLTIGSHKSFGPETPPAILIRAEVPADIAGKLSGATLRGEMFVQTAAAGPIWHTQSGETVEVAITRADATLIAGEIVGGVLSVSGGKDPVEAKGKFEARLTNP